MYYLCEIFYCFLYVLNILWYLVDFLFLVSVGLVVIGFFCFVVGFIFIVVIKKGKFIFWYFENIKVRFLMNEKYKLNMYGLEWICFLFCFLG